MEHDSEEFTPIIASGIEYSGISTYRAPTARHPSPRIPPSAPQLPPHLPQKKVPVTPSRLGSGKIKTVSENGRIMSTPRVLKQSKSLPFNYGMPEESTPSPWRTKSGGIPVAPVKQRNAELSTPSPWRSMSTGRGGDAAVKQRQQQQQKTMSAEYRLSNGHSRGEDASTKSAPIRHLSFSRCSFKQVSVDIRRLRQLAVLTPAIRNQVQT